MQSTKQTQFIVCFITEYLNEEQRRNFEAIFHVNQMTNEQLSFKCYVIGKQNIVFGRYNDGGSCALFLHSHPIVPNCDEEHEGNMLLINKMMEKMLEVRMTDKFVYGTNRHIIIF